MFSIQKQMARLIAVSGIASFQLAGASWVVLLAARGFTLAEIGIAEAVFHVASLTFEIPSGVISDVFGRRKSMVLSCVMRITSLLLMAFSNSLSDVCAALVFAAFSYNFASGTQEALAYDSLKTHGCESHYLKYSSVEMAVYRAGSSLATLLAGAALMLGYRRAYLLDAGLGLVCLAVTMGLHEAQPEEKPKSENTAAAIKKCVLDAVRFLLKEKRARRLMLFNAFAGACAILLVFFLQARLTRAGVSAAMLGPALFVIGLGGVAGARMAVRVKAWRYAHVGILCVAGVAMGIILGVGSIPLLMCIGGFAANMFDDLLQVRTDSLLQDMFPSSQRATLVSVSSLLFSMVMIMLSPLAGWFYGLL